MFSKTAPSASAPQIPQSDGRNTTKSVFGPDLELTGEITTSGKLEILGAIKGNVAADQLIIGATGNLSGEVRANSIDVLGTLEGRADSQSCIIRSSGKVKADILYDKVTIETGASIEGRLAKLR